MNYQPVKVTLIPSQEGPISSIFHILNFRQFLTENTFVVYDKEQRFMPYLLSERCETLKQTLWQDAIS